MLQPIHQLLYYVGRRDTDRVTVCLIRRRNKCTEMIVNETLISVMAYQLEISRLAYYCAVH